MWYNGLSMRIFFFGAAGQVTGSCFLVETKRARVLVDCGMFQGSNFNEGRNHDAFEFDPKTIDAVFVTHAHVDHNGRIPKLAHDGFKGKVYATKGTKDLMHIVWADALKIMTYNKKRYGMPLLYHDADVAVAAAHSKGVDYGKKVSVKGVSVTFHDAGHILGSSFIELEADGKRVIFSGDIGNENVPILKDTQGIGKAIDALIIESTYGDRIHETTTQRRAIIKKTVSEALMGGGTLMIPAFSIERTQELIYELNHLIEHEKVLPRVPFYLDSPMAIAALAVYKRYPQYYDKTAKELRESGDDFLKFPGLVLTKTAQDSKKINVDRGSKVIIAGSGMMTGGRILHHAVRYLTDPKNTLLIVGYTAKNTLGRKLYEGKKRVTIMNKRITVKAKVKAIGALSAHGDQKKLIKWAKSAKGSPKHIFVVHGEDHSSGALAKKLSACFKKASVVVPEEGQSFEI